jgi:hypothetical protein
MSAQVERAGRKGDRSEKLQRFTPLSHEWERGRGRGRISSVMYQ